MKENVKQKYGEIASGERKIGTSAGSCCSPGCGCTDGTEVVDISESYRDADRSAIPPGADLGLGCGTPTVYAEIQEGMIVLDLGSGAGIDSFVASKYVGDSGRVIGVDMTEGMIFSANVNKEKAGVKNVEFRLGEIESLPVESGSIDRVISNCVINLVPDKEKAFREIYRVLKPNGKFIVSDIVVDGVISEKEKRDAALWAGCISGALSREEYIGIAVRAGFKDIVITAERKYDYTVESGGSLCSVTLSGTKYCEKR